MFKTAPIALALTALLAACGSAPGDRLDSSTHAIVDSDEIAFILSLSADERSGTVQFVNDGNTTRQMLDDDCRLHSDAARHIDRYKLRKGSFETIRQIADVKQVGVYNLSLLVDCATDKGFIVVVTPPPPTATTTTLIEWYYGDLDPALQGVVDALVGLAQDTVACDPATTQWNCYSATFNFWSAEITSVDGVAVSYLVEIGRVIDPDGGIVEYVVYSLDANMHIIDEYWDAG